MAKRALFEIFEMYTTPSGMTSSKFIKIMKDSNLIDAGTTQTDLDLIFTKVKAKGQRSITFDDFKRAVGMIAARKNVSTTDLVDYMHMTTADGPSFAGTTVPVETRFYDDKDTYTGVHKAGGPTVVDKDKPQLHNLLDRSSADVRGVKQVMKEAHGRQSMAGGSGAQQQQPRHIGYPPAGDHGGGLPQPPPSRPAPAAPPGASRNGDNAAMLENLETRIRRTSITAGSDGPYEAARGVSTRTSITNHLQSRITPPAPPPAAMRSAPHRAPPLPSEVAHRREDYYYDDRDVSGANDQGAYSAHDMYSHARHVPVSGQAKHPSPPVRGAPGQSSGHHHLDPEKRLFAVYKTFCSNHPDTLEMDSARFVKFCRDSGLLGTQLNTTAADLIFQKAKKSGNYGKRITYEDFRMVAIPEIAKKLSIGVEDVIAQALYCEGPSLTNPTVAQEVRFHDDVSTYTGVHHNGQTPSFSASSTTIALESLLDRSQADSRGVKLSDAAAAARAAAQRRPGEVTYAGEANKSGGIFDRLSNKESFTGVYAERFKGPTSNKGSQEFRGHTNTGTDEAVYDIRQIVTRR